MDGQCSSLRSFQAIGNEIENMELLLLCAQKRLNKLPKNHFVLIQSWVGIHCATLNCFVDGIKFRCDLQVELLLLLFQRLIILIQLHYKNIQFITPIRDYFFYVLRM